MLEVTTKPTLDDIDLQIELLRAQYRYVKRPFNFKVQGLSFTALEYLRLQDRLKTEIANLRKIRREILKSQNQDGKNGN